MSVFDPTACTVNASPLADLFESSAARAPQGPRGGATPEYLPAALRAAFDAYLGELDCFPTGTWAGDAVAASRPRTSRLAEGLAAALDAGLRGQLGRARKHLDEALDAVVDELNGLMSLPLDRGRLGTLYRVREEPPDRRFGPRDLSHIPFDLAHIVRPQRYSTPGTPMLYLGSSLIACWEEMGRPDPRSLWAAAFRLRPGRTIRVLNLAYRPALIASTARPLGSGPADDPSDMLRQFVGYAVIWPLVLACSYRVLHRGQSFVPEYVLPQLLTSWLAEQPELSGVRYFSNRMDDAVGPTRVSSRNSVAVPL